MKYIAFIHKEDDSYVAAVPDLNYTSSFGDTFEEAVDNIKEAAELYCEDEEELPKASSYEELLENADIEKGSTPQLIDVKVEKNVRFNVIMPMDIKDKVDAKAAITHKGNRSAYLTDLAREDVAVS